MAVAKLIALKTAVLTPQQIADMALVEDQMSRRAKLRGEDIDAIEHETERDKLCDLSHQ